MAPGHPHCRAEYFVCTLFRLDPVGAIISWLMAALMVFAGVMKMLGKKP